MSITLAATLLLAAAQPAPTPDLEPARDALRRHELARAAALLEPIAEGGDGEANYRLALLFLPRTNDVGLPPDPPRACRLLLRAAAAPYPKAAYTLAAQVEAGVCTETGRSAAEWSALAAAGGHTEVTGAAAGKAATIEDPATLLKRAARAGDVGALTRLLVSSPATLVGPDKRTALHEAAEGKHADAARLLLDHGAQVDARDAAGLTPLLVAAQEGAGDVVQVLLDTKADPNVRDRFDDTPLMLAAAVGARESVDLLLKHGADASLRNAQGLSALDFAERAGSVPDAQTIAAELKAHGAKAVERAAVARERSADDVFAGWPPQVVAAERGDLAALRQALGAGADVNASEPRGDTALLVAARAGHVAVVEALLSAGATLDARAKDGDSALGRALRRHQTATVKVLLAHRANPNSPQAGGVAPLMLAVDAGDAEAVRLLTAAGAQVNGADANGRTALMAAAERDDAAMVGVLLAAHADARQRDATGRTALARAVQAGAGHAGPVLIAAGDLDLADRDNLTPLGIAAQRGDVQMTRNLLGAHAALEGRTRGGNTPLLLAAAAGRTATVRELVSAGAKLEARNDLGNTALLLAVSGGHGETAKALIDLGADQRIRNSASQSVKDLARQSGDPALARLFGAT